VSVGGISRAAAVATFAALTLPLTLTSGCGGAAFTEGDADVAPDATAGDSSQAESGPEAETSAPGCILPPNGVGNEGEVCSILASTASGCGECEMCRQLDVNDCVALGDTLSDAFKNALQECSSRLGCGDLSSLVNNNPCIRAHLAAAAPNVVQQAVRTAYCKACPSNVAECQGFFDLSIDGGTTGYGLWAMVLDDSLDEQIISTCSSSTPPHCDAVGYNVCGALLFCGKAPHSHCPHGLHNP
jgi:hypothetical protein